MKIKTILTSVIFMGGLIAGEPVMASEVEVLLNDLRYEIPAYCTLKNSKDYIVQMERHDLRSKIRRLWDMVWRSGSKEATLEYNRLIICAARRECFAESSEWLDEKFWLFGDGPYDSRVYEFLILDDPKGFIDAMDYISEMNIRVKEFCWSRSRDSKIWQSKKDALDSVAKAKAQIKYYMRTSLEDKSSTDLAVLEELVTAYDLILEFGGLCYATATTWENETVDLFDGPPPYMGARSKQK
ncbi:hypothetical protein ACFL6Y_09905 [Elusimicrobiota bacterium]